MVRHPLVAPLTPTLLFSPGFYCNSCVHHFQAFCVVVFLVVCHWHQPMVTVGQTYWKDLVPYPKLKTNKQKTKNEVDFTSTPRSSHSNKRTLLLCVLFFFFFFSLSFFLSSLSSFAVLLFPPFSPSLSYIIMFLSDFYFIIIARVIFYLCYLSLKYHYDHYFLCTCITRASLISCKLVGAPAYFVS